MKLVLLGLDSCQCSVLWSRTEFPELLRTLIEETTVVVNEIHLRILAVSGAKKSTKLLVLKPFMEFSLYETNLKMQYKTELGRILTFMFI